MSSELIELGPQGLALDPQGISLGPQRVVLDSQGVSFGPQRIMLDLQGVSLGPQRVVIDSQVSDLARGNVSQGLLDRSQLAAQSLALRLTLTQGGLQLRKFGL
jgi:hypothetical protein